MIDAINLAGQCRNGYLPKAGGLLDQSAWFVSLWQAMQVDEGKIREEQLERKSKSAR